MLLVSAWCGGEGRNRGGSFFVEKQVHDPVAADVRSRAPAVAQHGGVSAARLFERVGQDAEASRVEQSGRQDAFVVSRLSELDKRSIFPRQQGSVERREGSGKGTEDVADQVTPIPLLFLLFPLRCGS